MIEKANNYSQKADGICYIVGAGEPFIPFSKNENDVIIAADGGCDKLLKYSVVPDLIIGDLDSVSGGNAPTDTGVPVERHPVKKDETDMALCVLRGHEMGYRHFVLLGGTGGREDHTFANYQLLLRMRRMGLDGVLVGRSQLVRVLENGTCTLHGKAGDTLSVFALENVARGVTIEGAEYPLTDGTLRADFALGVSNSFSAETVKIRVSDGALLIFSPLYDLKKIEFC